MTPSFPRPPQATFAHFPQLRHLRLLWPFSMQWEYLCHTLPGEISFSRSTATTHQCQLRILQGPYSFRFSLSNTLKYMKVHTGGSADHSRSPWLQVSCFPHCRRRRRGAWCSRTLKHSSFPRSACCVHEGLALTPRLVVMKSKWGVELLFWSSSTNRGYTSQHKRVRKPFCYWKNKKIDLQQNWTINLLGFSLVKNSLCVW